jgi:hypothetical protein
MDAPEVKDDSLPIQYRHCCGFSAVLLRAVQGPLFLAIPATTMRAQAAARSAAETIPIANFMISINSSVLRGKLFP